MPRKGKKAKAAKQREQRKNDHHVREPAPCPINNSEMEDSHKDLIGNGSKVISGTIHQGDTRFHYPGIQCTYISFLSLVRMMVKKPETWNAGDIDACVIDGNWYFIEHCHALHIEPKMLMANELPEFIWFFEKEFFCNVVDSQIIVGTLKPNRDLPTERGIKSIFDGLTEVFNDAKSCLLICGGQTVALARQGNYFYSFDPHSRGRNGLLSPTGTAVMVMFPTLNKMIIHFESLFLESLHLQTSEQYELVPLNISQQTFEEPKSLGKGDPHISNTDSTSTVKSFGEMSKNKTLSPEKEKDSSAMTSKAMTSYFEDQKVRDKLFQENKINQNSTKATDRARYMQNYMKRKRKIETFKNEENRNARLRMQRIRSTSEGKRQNKERSADGMRKLLKDKDKRVKHNQMSVETMRKRLSVSDERVKHNERSADSMRKMLTNDTKRQKHNERSVENMRKMLKDETKKQKHNNKSAEGMRKKLKNDIERQRHKENAVASMKKMLLDDQKRQRHREQSLKAMRKRLKSQLNRQQHTKKTLESIRKGLTDEHKRQMHRKRTADGMRKMMSDEQKRKKHQEKSALGMRQARKRKSYNDHDYILKKKRNKGLSFTDAIDKFNAAIQMSCSYVCTCCHQTWFKQSVKLLSSVENNIDSALLSKCTTGYRSVENTEWICNTCLSNIKQDKVPKLSVANGMEFPAKLPALDLNNLEERLISLRIPFMQIRALNSGGQFSLKGSVVNVPTEIEPTIRALPRLQRDSETVPVKLKRMKEYKHAVVTENVRPAFVLNALRTLMDTSELYKNANLSIDDNWTTSNAAINIENEAEMTQTNDETDTFSEVEDETPVMTFLDDKSCDRNTIISVAPGEGQRPLSIFKDPDSEYLSFPTLFCGQKRIPNSERQTSVHYSDICKWELRCVDRRVALHIPNLFYKMKKLQTEQVCSKAHLAVRRCKTKGKSYTAGYILKDNMGESLVRLDEGYRIFKTIRNSPQYWEHQKKDVFAMIRQLGIPTLFLSLSANDLHWSELIIALGKLVDNKDYTEAVTNNSLSWETRSRLVQSDPVTCVRHFDHRVSQFIQMVLKSPNSPLGDLEDYFYRVEFQQRGSPHIHMLIWIQNSPKYGEDDETSVIEYIDKVASCSSNVLSESIEFLAMQTHKHSRSCRKGGKPECRFGIPFPPMRTTMILQPYEGEDRSIFEDHYKTVQNHLASVDEGETFDTFLQKIGLSESDYLKAIQTSLTNEKVFLKREPCANRINPYIRQLLNVWEANHDVQFVLDAYACAMYIVSYINKSSKGMSTLMAEACKEARKGNKTLKQSVRHIGNKFLNAVEVSAQEAAYLILQQSMSQKSRGCEFIPTAPLGERTFLMKTQKELEALPDDSIDIESDNVVKRYSRRHKILEHYCLADFVSKVITVMPLKQIKDEAVDYVQRIHDEEKSTSDVEHETEKAHKLRYSVIDGDYRINLRSKPKIIRYVRYDKRTDPENHFREQLMLFCPWRNEETDLLGSFSSFEARYNSIYATIAETKHQYDANPELLEKVENASEIHATNNSEEVSPNIESVEAHDRETEPVLASKYEFYRPETRDHSHYDLGADIGLSTHIANDEVEMIQSRCNENEYLESLMKLNCKQRQVFTHIVHSITFMPENQLCLFITGGAGVGKSLVIRTLYQALHRMLCSKAGQNPDDIRIALCAYTGLAAYNINGSTLHSLFCIEPNKKLSYKPLSDEKRNTLRMTFMHLSVLIVDEVSMVGVGMLNFLQLRLQEIKGNKRLFGGVHVILVGDLFQLRPVGDSWIFSNNACDYTSLGPNLWQDHFKMFELTEIMRQKDDAVFAQLLNRIREGKQTKEDVSLICSRIIMATDPRYHELRHELHLFPCNADVDRHNGGLFREVSTEKVEIKCCDTVLGEDSDDVKKRILGQVKGKKANDTGNLSEVLNIAIGLHYDTTHNVSVGDGICNGTPCIVQKIHYIQQSAIPSCIWVKFPSSNIGSNTRKEYAHYYRKYPEVSREWTPIWSVRRTFMFRRKAIVRQQFPLKPSSAKTIHKAQGQTKSSIVVDMASGSRPHQHYVAFSRVTSLQGLHLLDGFSGKIKVDDQVVNEMARLRTQRSIDLSYEPFSANANEFRVVFQNVQSLWLHLPQIKTDSTFTSADVICLAETRLCSMDSDSEYLIEGYLPIVRNDQTTSQGLRPPHGLAMYVKQTFQIEHVQTVSTHDFECLIVDVRSPQLHNVHTIIVVYKSPNCSFKTFKGNALSFSKFRHSDNLVVVGDFNFDVTKSKNDGFQNLMRSVLPKAYLLKTLPTTWENTMLDLCFTSCNAALANIITCVWSYHHTLVVSLSLSN